MIAASFAQVAAGLSFTDFSCMAAADEHVLLIAEYPHDSVRMKLPSGKYGFIQPPLPHPHWLEMLRRPHGDLPVGLGPVKTARRFSCHIRGAVRYTFPPGDPMVMSFRNENSSVLWPLGIFISSYDVDGFESPVGHLDSHAGSGLSTVGTVT